MQKSIKVQCKESRIVEKKDVDSMYIVKLTDIFTIWDVLLLFQLSKKHPCACYWMGSLLKYPFSGQTYNIRVSPGKYICILHLKKYKIMPMINFKAIFYGTDSYPLSIQYHVVLI